MGSSEPREGEGSKAQCGALTQRQAAASPLALSELWSLLTGSSNCPRAPLTEKQAETAAKRRELPRGAVVRGSQDRRVQGTTRKAVKENMKRNKCVSPVSSY